MESITSYPLIIAAASYTIGTLIGILDEYESKKIATKKVFLRLNNLLIKNIRLLSRKLSLA